MNEFFLSVSWQRKEGEKGHEGINILLQASQYEASSPGVRSIGKSTCQLAYRDKISKK